MKNTRIIASLVVVSLMAVALPSLAQEDLTESFSTADGSLTFSYPAEWLAVELVAGMVVVGTGEDVITSFTDGSGDVSPNDMLLLIIGPQLTSIVFGDVSSLSLDEVLAIFTADDEYEFGESVSTTFAGHDARMVSVVTAESEGVGIVVEMDGKYILINATAASGEYDQYADTVLAIVDSLVYEIPEGLVTYEGQSITFDYPGSWTALAVIEGRYLLTNMQLGPEPKPGQVMIMINTPSDLLLNETQEATDIKTVALEFTADLNLYGGPQNELGEPEAVTIGIYEGVQVAYSNDVSEGIVFMLAVDGDFMAVTVATTPGELEDFEADIMSIIESIELISAEE